MAHDETIRIYRSDVPGAEPPSLTYGELAANLADRKVFVGGPGGTADMIVLLETPEPTGLPLATTGASGVASFFSGDFTVSTTGHVFLSRDFIDIYSGDGIDVVGGGGKVTLGESITIRNIGVTSVNGATGSINLIDFVQGEGIATRSQGNKIILTNIGVTGISAGHTGIALNGTTGNVQIFNMGVLSLDGQTGHLSRGATGDTITAGLAIGVSVVSGNNKRIDNLGVTSFNGLTGAVRYAPPLATNGASGVASFLSRDFSVSNTGHVSLSNNFIEINIGNGISVFPEGRVDLGQAVTIRNIGVTSFNGSTGSISLIDFVQGAGIATIAAGNKVTFANIGVTSFNGQTGSVVYHPPIASEGASGVASFDDSNFRVTSTGHVYIKTGGIGKTELEDSGITINTNTGSGLVGGGTVDLGSSLTLTNVGVTGISAGHTGIALIGTTGNVHIFNMGVLSIDGKTGHYTTPPLGVTGDTITPGLAIGVSVVSGNNKRIDNLGVTSFNGLTGAVTLTGDGGAIVGTGNNRIIARLVTSGTTGIASFNTTHFSVSSSTGHVSLATPYTVTGHTVLSGVGIGIVAGADNSRIINNLGVTSFNGLTGAVSYAPPLATIGASGVASFSSTNFSVSSTGHVFIKTGGIGKTDLANPTININTNTGSGLTGGGNVDLGASLTLTNIGVTGISAGHTGISLVGTTGNVRIFNMGVHTFNGSTGHITFNPATGNTVLAGSGIAIPNSLDNTRTIINVGVTGIGFGTSDAGLTGKINLTSGTSITFDLLANNTIKINSTGVVGSTGDTVAAGVGMSVVRTGGTNVVTINNLGVTSFNGLTGAVTLTGDGGAIVGASNNTIRARLAGASLTGVASFPTTDFGVVNGQVSLTGNVARTNQSNVFLSAQFFPGRFTALGATFTSLGVNITSGGNLNVASPGKVIAPNISPMAGFNWSLVTTDGNVSLNKGILANKSPSNGKLVLTLNTNNTELAVGSVVRVSGVTGSWEIRAPGGSQIHFGNVSLTPINGLPQYGYLSSTHHRDSVELVCYGVQSLGGVGGTGAFWNVISSVGSIETGIGFEIFEGSVVL